MDEIGLRLRMPHARRSHAFLRLAYAAAMCRNHDLAQVSYFTQYELFKEPWRELASRTWRVIQKKVLSERSRHDVNRVGVFFLNSTEALGHAILDSYHFLAVYHDRFDATRHDLWGSGQFAKRVPHFPTGPTIATEAVN